MGQSTLAVLVAICGGGGLGAIIVALINKRKVDAEAKNTNVQSILDVDQRLNERLVRLEQRVMHLEEENLKLREENFKLKTEVFHENVIVPSKKPT